MSTTERRTSVATRAAVAGSLGTMFEFYDFVIYGLSTALVFNVLFFPADDPLVGTLLAFATFAVGFLARPIGGILFGHLGDRRGRKPAIVMTITIMGVATVLIGALPTYATIGVWAPILLLVLRIAQGIALGGEFGGAGVLAVEHALPGRRGLAGGIVAGGNAVGVILATAVFAAVTTFLPEQTFLTWGWRVPFLASALILVVSVFIRVGIPETPDFAGTDDATQAPARPLPFAEVLTRYRRNVLVAAAAPIANTAWGYLLGVFVVFYATSQLGMDNGQFLLFILVGNVVYGISTVASGALSDRYGRKPVYLTGVAMLAIVVFPFFAVLQTREPGLVLGAIVVANLVLGQLFGVQAAFFAELFGAEVRYTGVSLGFQVGAVLGGGVTPLLATALLQSSVWLVPGYIALLALLSAFAVSRAGRQDSFARDEEAVTR